MASVSPLLPAATSKAPKYPNPKISLLPLSLFSSASIYRDPQYTNPFLTTRNKSSLHRFHSNTEVFDLATRPRFSRRDALLAILLSTSSLPFLVSGAFAESDLQGSFRVFEDETNKFRIFIPAGWSVGAGETSRIKSVTAFYPQEASSSNVSITITGLGADFTALESFGKVDAFAETLVNGLDKSWQRPPGMAAKLVNSAAANGLYYIEYTLQNPGERCRHIFSAIGIASNGWYNRLYTVTGQFMEDDSANFKSLIEKSVLSFRLM